MEIESRQMDVPMVSEELAMQLAKILIKYDNTYIDVSIDRLQGNLLNQIEECKANGDIDKIKSIIKQLDKAAELGIMTEIDSKIAFKCKDNLEAIQQKYDVQDIEINQEEEIVLPENHYNSVADIIQSQLPQAEQDREIALLLQYQGRSENFIVTTQFLAKNRPDMAVQLADQNFVISEKENSHKFMVQDKIQEQRDNPLNKIEELLEGNYNQIDGIINNLPLEETNRDGFSFKETIELYKEKAEERNRKMNEKYADKSNAFYL